jgi:hypothetical protein
MATQTTPQPPTSAKSVRFSDLWNNYPNSDPCVNTRTGKPAYDDQCAVRLGMALQKSGVNFKSFGGPRCEFGPPGNGMVLRAQELADWLRRSPFPGCPTARILAPGKGFATTLRGKTGIIFFQHYWLRGGERLDANKTAPFGTGNHIDLWRMDTLTPAFHNFLRFNLHIDHFPSLNPLSPPGHNWYSDLNNATKIFFWQIA